jgi:DNA-binding response OmpR family regulator
MADKLRLLLVEDEAHLATGLKINFELEGFVVDVARTGRESGPLLLQNTYAVLILDVMLPDMNGFDLCKQIRNAGNFTPVLMLTARASAEDRVRGLNAGADDYLSKPFELAELIARVRSLIRRQEWHQKPSIGSALLAFGDAKVNFDTHEVTVKNKPLQLTQLELDLLRYFASNAGRVLSRQELLENVWRLANYPHTRTVDNFVMRLRKYFEPKPAKPRYFVAMRGAGYRFVP